MTAELELEIWRRTCSQGDLTALIEDLASVLSRRVPFAMLLLRRLDLDHARFETIAVTHGGKIAAPKRARTDLTRDEKDAVVAWCLEGGVAALDTEETGGWQRALVPDGISGPCLAGGLHDSAGPAGAIVFVGRPRGVFRKEHTKIVRALLAPLSAALERDRLLHDVTRLREAALAEKRALTQPQDITESIVGAEAGLRPVMERVELVARAETPVLIFGETGSGKEVVARAIHARSSRRAGPILRINCGAIPPDLVDSELFGHERGSFTGAVSTRKGWFERADGGTLFLDEIGELLPAAQVRLLRILQDGSFERVGGQRTLTVDVRIVAATHRDLQAMVRERRFREDLWYRINVFPIILPPLRDRREDIPALAALFSRRAGLRLGASPLVPSPEDIEHLLAYDWPGNVRELAAVIERAVLLGNGRRLELAMALGSPAPRTAMPDAPAPATVHGSATAFVHALPDAPAFDPGRPATQVSAPTSESAPRAASTPALLPASPAHSMPALLPGSPAASLAAPLTGSSTMPLHALWPAAGMAPATMHPTSRVPTSGGASSVGPHAGTIPFPTLDTSMASHIESALAATRGRIEGPNGAAILLGINPHTLRARMRKLGIDWSRFRRPRPRP